MLDTRTKLSAAAILFSCLCLQGVPWAWGQSADTAKLTEGAKKEGELVIYGSMNLRDANLIMGKFREKYPFVDAKLNRLGNKILPKVLAETRAGKFFADILQNNALGLHFLKKGGLLASYLSPEDRFYPKQFKDPGYWTTTNMNVHVIAYNTKLVARGKLPKRWEDLLNPTWKGKMMLDPSEQWFAWILQVMGEEKGLNYMRELAKQNIAIRSESNAMRAELIAAGEVGLDIDGSYGPVTQLQRRGAPIDWTTLGPVLVIPSGHGIAARAPHPNAAKLFTDFLLSKEGQRLVLSLDRQVIRSDLFHEQAAIKDLQLVPADPALGENMDSFGKQAREIFSR
ncbi:MAG: extracellular solute-binding protein [Deltaproteobacteria bacterium]|nr:extracellular solute-binding protein [Deltaproteobacteria bacterium]